MRPAKKNNYWPLGDYLDIAIQALESDQPRGNACRCGMGQYGFHLMMASAPWGFFKDSPFSDWSGDGFDYTPAHEYWHILHFAHLSNKDDFGNRQGATLIDRCVGPTGLSRCPLFIWRTSRSPNKSYRHMNLFRVIREKNASSVKCKIN